jgi:hypothetical protein
MANTDKIDALISTVRDLNHLVRPKLTDEIGGGSGNMAEVHKIIGEMRDRELIASHSIKRMLLGNREGVEAEEIQSMMGTAGTQITLEEALAIHDDVSEISTREVLSGFGTAREAILSLVRDLSDSDWTTTSTLGDSDDRNSVAAAVDALIADDQAALARIKQLIS